LFSLLKVDSLTTLNEVIDNNDTVVISFTAPSWCVPCQRLKPHFQAAGEKSTAIFVEVDVDQHPDIADAFQVKSVPTVQLYRHATFFDYVNGRTAVAILNEVG
jgi:thioredoxin 1